MQDSIIDACLIVLPPLQESAAEMLCERKNIAASIKVSSEGMCANHGCRSSAVFYPQSDVGLCRARAYIAQQTVVRE